MERVENNSYNILDGYYERKLEELDERLKYHILGTGRRYIQGFGGGKPGGKGNLEDLLVD